MNNSLNLFKAYLKFRKQSVNAHGLHSPFVYNLATQCLYDRSSYADYKILKEYNKALLKDHTLINMHDLGAGSRKLSNPKRTVKQIARISGSSYADMKLYYRLARYFKPENILELGTSLGKSALAFSLGAPQAVVKTLEGDPVVAKTASKYLQTFNRKNIQVVHTDFDAYLQDLPKTKPVFDMVILDGNHRLKPTLQYFESLLPYLHENSIVIVDDIYWSKEMTAAWQALQKHPQVFQTVDVFHFGLLFFRKGQFKQHFKINLHTLNLF